MGDSTVFFDTEWYRPPSPHQPVPDLRVTIHFVVSYERQPASENFVPPPFTPSKLDFGFIDVGLGPPSISWRIQHDEQVHTDLENIDHHIQRCLKFKTEFFKKYPPIKFDHSETLESRLKWDAATAASTITDSLFEFGFGGDHSLDQESSQRDLASKAQSSAHSFSAHRSLLDKVRKDPKGVLANLYGLGDDDNDNDARGGARDATSGKPCIVEAPVLRGAEWVAQYSDTSAAAITTASQHSELRSAATDLTERTSVGTVGSKQFGEKSKSSQLPAIIPIQQIEQALRQALKMITITQSSEQSKGNTLPSNSISGSKSDQTVVKRNTGTSESHSSPCVVLGEFTAVLVRTIQELKAADLIPYLNDSDIVALQQAASDTQKEQVASSRLGEGLKALLDVTGNKAKKQATEEEPPLRERKVDVAIALNTAFEYIRALRATRTAVRVNAEREAQAYQKAVARVRASPSLHKAMDESLTKLDPTATGRVSHEAFIRFLGSLDLNLVSSEIRNIYELSPRVPSASSDSQPDVLYQVFQMCYQQIIEEALKNRELEAARNDVGIYLLDLMNARHSAFSSLAASAVASGKLSAEQANALVSFAPKGFGKTSDCKPTGRFSSVPFGPYSGFGLYSEPRPALPVSWARDVLSKDATRVRLTQLQVYSLFRGVGRQVQYVSADSNHQASFGVKLPSAEQPQLASAIADGEAGQIPLDIAGFSRAASIVVYAIYEDALKKSGLGNAAVAGMGLISSYSTSFNNVASGGSTNSSGGFSNSNQNGFVKEGTPSETKEERELRMKFIEFDADEDGRLDADEFLRCLSSETNLRLSGEQISLLRDAADLNRDGFVEWSEFLYFGSNILPNLHKDPLIRVSKPEPYSNGQYGEPRHHLGGVNLPKNKIAAGQSQIKISPSYNQSDVGEL